MTGRATYEQRDRGTPRPPARFLLGEAWAGLRRNLTLTVAVVVSVFVSLTLLGVALLLSKQIAVNKDYWYDRVEVSVFLCGPASTASPAERCPGEVTAAQRDALAATLHGLPQVQQVHYESREQAYERSRAMPALRALSESVTAEALPESFRVKLADPTQYDAVTAAVGAAPGVETVEDQRRLLDPLVNLLATLRTGAFAVAAVQLAAAALLVMNSIRVAAFTRRREIGIMRLVGASRLSISLPFLLEGAAAGLLGALGAVAALTAGYQLLVVDWLAPRLPVFQYLGWAEVVTTLPWLVLAGVALSGTAALASVARHVRV